MSDINMISEVMELPDNLISEPVETTRVDKPFVPRGAISTQPYSYGENWESPDTSSSEGIDWYNELPYTEEEGILTKEESKQFKQFYDDMYPIIWAMTGPAVPMYNWFTRDLW